LKLFTELTVEEIYSIELLHRADPAKREAQRKLATVMTEKVHGVTDRANAEKASGALFGKGSSLSDVDEATLLEVVKEAPSSTFAKAKLEGEGCPVIDVLAEASKLWPSRGEVKRA